MFWIDVVLVIVGLALVVKASQLAVGSLLWLSEEFGLTEFTTSFLVIGIASVLPELALGLAAAFEGASDFGIGIVFGANILDLTLVLGIVAIYANGLKVESKTVRDNLYFLLLSALPVALVWDGELTRFDGVVLLAAFFVYVLWLARERKGFTRKIAASRDTDLPDQLVIAVFSIVVLFGGAYLAAHAATSISVGLGVPVLFLGLVLALGTCLPELSFSLQALAEKHPELGLGDIVGNVVTDCTFTLGVLALVRPISISDGGVLSVGVSMLLAALLAVWFMRSGASLSRREGVVLVLAYAGFVLAQVFLV